MMFGHGSQYLDGLRRMMVHQRDEGFQMLLLHRTHIDDAQRRSQERFFKHGIRVSFELQLDQLIDDLPEKGCLQFLNGCILRERLWFPDCGDLMPQQLGKGRILHGEHAVFYFEIPFRHVGIGKRVAGGFEDTGQPDIPAGGTDGDTVGSSLHTPVIQSSVIILQVGIRKFKTDFRMSAWLQMDLLELLQFLLCTRDAGCCMTEIQLYDFLSRHFPGVLYITGDDDIVAVPRNDRGNSLDPETGIIK